MQAKIADMYTACQTTRSYLYSSAKMFDSGVNSNMASAAIFLQASRVAVDVSLECM